MSSPRPVPFPTGFVVKNGSKMRSRSPGEFPVRRRRRARPLSAPATRGNGDAPSRRVKRVVDQVRPHLVQLAAEPAYARQIVLDVHVHLHGLPRAFPASTAIVSVSPLPTSTGSGIVAWSMYVKPSPPRRALDAGCGPLDFRSQRRVAQPLRAIGAAASSASPSSAFASRSRRRRERGLRERHGGG